MTRRIALTFLALIAGLLVLAVVPLGISMSANERASFQNETETAARLVSSSAEEYLSDHHAQASMHEAIATAAAQGDCAAVYDTHGAQIAATSCPAASDADSRALAAEVLAGSGQIVRRDGDWLRVAVVVGDDDQTSGAVVFARSADPLDDRIAVMWGWLTLMAVAGLAAGAGLSVWLARWVSRPLSALGAAAASLGDGALDARAPDGSGPREVRALAATFNRMADRTQTLIHSHRGWVADVSHQLRTPLTALRLRLDLLADDVGEGAAAELAGAQEEIARLSRLVDGLLAVARAEAATPRPRPVRVDQVAAERAAAWDPVARERRVSLTVVPGPAVTAYLGAGDLEQMLDNVIANALEAVADGGSVRVEATVRREKVQVTVADDGPGMGEEAKDAAFHRFANPGARGNGLGLAIVHRLAAANGGGVELRDSPGGGLTVVLTLAAERVGAPV